MRGQATTKPVTIGDIGWMTGNWRCENDWGVSHADWMVPAGGSMACLYRLVSKGQPVFYEFVTISEQNASLVMKLKHFNANMKAWEEKDKTVDFQLISISPGEIVFDAPQVKKKITYTKISANAIECSFVSEQDGKVEVTKFNYTK